MTFLFQHDQPRRFGIHKLISATVCFFRSVPSSTLCQPSNFFFFLFDLVDTVRELLCQMTQSKWRRIRRITLTTSLNCMLSLLTTNWHAPDAAASCMVGPVHSRACGATRQSTFRAGRRKKQHKPDANVELMLQLCFPFFVAGHGSSCSFDLDIGTLSALGSQGTNRIRKGVSGVLQFNPNALGLSIHNEVVIPTVTFLPPAPRTKKINPNH